MTPHDNKTKMLQPHCFTKASSRLKQLVFDELRTWGAHIKPQKIVLKPNWVLHETDSAFPIRGLVTDPRLIDATLEACLELFPGAKSILVGDCPLQYADWPLMSSQCNLEPIIEKYKHTAGGKVVFRDLRKFACKADKSNFFVESTDEHGDPNGYRKVELGGESHLESISDQAGRFAVNDYSASVTRSNHKKGSHCYLVAQSVLDADLFINLPKWKSHQKSGITCALKNLVGINGDKAYLPHFRRGSPKWGGDEYRDENRWLYWAQTRTREALQKRSRLGFKLLKPGWEVLKKIRGIETRVTDPRNPPKNAYLAGGSWFGNDTIWRMIFDLNRVIQCTDAAGKLHQKPQRKYFCIVDGLISGEGNGPLQALPRETDWLVFGEDPFAIDAALSHFMGFNPDLIPIIKQRDQYTGPDWGDFTLEELSVLLDGKFVHVQQSGINFEFLPAPGWRKHIER